MNASVSKLSPRPSTRPACRLAFVILGLGIPASGALAAGGSVVEYNRDIRPILADTCFACHGPDSAARKGDLRLDIRDEALAAEAFVPGDADASEFMYRILTDDEDDLMPPAKTHKVLTADQKALLKRWIDEGAEYEPHWSLIPPARPDLPAVGNGAWIRNPVDRFILGALEAKGLAPAPEADRATLIRRVSLDLTGLPPSPDEVEAFINDPAPDAYEKLVDRLLASPHWGEHRGRYWLDAARYADTHGIHFDNFREIWAYRDWVIKAFNANMPFDRFTVEQLAGDLLPDPSLDQLVATGFNRCNITTNEGGVIPEEYNVLYTRDRTETTSQVWLGLTANCATCHDHKFDPLSQREFYELSAFFNNTTQNAMDGNIKDTPPVVPVPLDEDRERWSAIGGEIAAAERTLGERREGARDEFTAWSAGLTPEAVRSLVPADGLVIHAPLAEGSGSRITFTDGSGAARSAEVAADPAWEAGHVAAFAVRPAAGGIALPGAGDFERDQPFTAAAWIRLPDGTNTGSVFARMDEASGYRGWDLWVENGRLGSHLVNTWPDNALKVLTREPVKRNQWVHVAITYDGSSKAEGLRIYFDGAEQATNPANNSLRDSIRTSVPLKVGQRHAGQGAEGVLVQDLRLHDRALAAAEVAMLGASSRAAFLAAKPADQRSEAEGAELFDWWLAAVDPAFRDATARLAGLRDEKSAIQSRGTIAHVMQERGEPASAFVLFRGEYDKRRDQVEPRTPAMLPPMPDDLPRNRLGLAEWLLLPEQPLTARVTVNRFWQEVFGTGIVRTAGDFGVSGELPINQELLDWLAVDFRESGWDVKRFFRQLVTSSSYRQSAVTTPEKLEADGDNRLLSRGPRFRMDAEMVRDHALAASGLLVRKLGGPSVKPYQPDGVWEAVAMLESNTHTYVRDDGENLYRRSMYTFWKRSAPPASMEIFNAPNRETCAVRRERTNTPLQALVTLNDVQFVEAARTLAERVLLDLPQAPASERIDALGLHLVARPFRPAEHDVIAESLQRLDAHYRNHPDDAAALLTEGERKPDPALDPVALATWTMLTNQLMNLDEVLVK